VQALRALPAHGEIADLGVEMVHASLRDPTHDFIRSAADAYMNMPLATKPLVLFGHTHAPAFFISQTKGLPRSPRIVIGEEYLLPDGPTYLLNPGCGCDERGARWLELRLGGERRSAIWHQTDVSGHGGVFSITSD
jgi:hypothetical protein